MSLHLGFFLNLPFQLSWLASTPWGFICLHLLALGLQTQDAMASLKKKVSA